MNNKKNNNLIMNSWTEEFAKYIAVESYNLMTAIRQNKDYKLTSDLSTRFLKYYIQIILVEALTQYKDHNLDDQDMYDFTRINFSNIKLDIQKNIAEGFEEAFKEFSKKDIEYYCVINVVPEPISKEIC